MNKAFLPAHRLAALVRQGKIGCLELLNSYLERIQQYNPALNAIVVFDGAYRSGSDPPHAARPAIPQPRR